METLSFSLFWSSLEQLLRMTQLFQSEVVPASWCRGKIQPWNNAPNVTSFWWGERKGALSLSGTIIPFSTHTHLSHSMFHVIFVILFWLNIMLFEWVVIAVSVSKWDVNTLRILAHECKLSSILQREEIQLLNINSSPEIRIQRLDKICLVHLLSKSEW